MTHSSSSAIVIGAGISGLACAYTLRNCGIDTLVLESSARPGGVIRSEQRDGFLFECGPQSFTSTSHLSRVVQELSLADELVEAAPRAPRYVLVNGTLQPVPLSPAAFFSTSLVGFRTKWCILSEPLRKTSPPEPDESIADFTRRKFTAELLERLAAPFVSGIYAGDPEKLSLRGAFPTVHEAEKSAGSIVRGMIRNARSKTQPAHKPKLASFRGGNEVLIRALAEKLGPALHTQAEVCQVSRTTEGNFQLTVQESGSPRAYTANHLVFATPAGVSARLLQEILPKVCGALNEIEYAPVAVVSMGYRHEDVGHPLYGFGFLVPRSAGLRTLGTVWNSSLFPSRAPEGHVLLTSFVGGAADPGAVDLSAGQLTSLVHSELSPLLSIAKPPIIANVTLHRQAIPQYNLGHSQRVASIESSRASCPDLWLLGNFFRGPAIGACIDRALSVAEELRISYNS